MEVHYLRLSASSPGRSCVMNFASQNLPVPRYTVPSSVLTLLPSLALCNLAEQNSRCLNLLTILHCLGRSRSPPCHNNHSRPISLWCKYAQPSHPAQVPIAPKPLFQALPSLPYLTASACTRWCCYKDSTSRAFCCQKRWVFSRRHPSLSHRRRHRNRHH